LPPLPAVPEIDNLRNAFWQPPHDAPLDATTAVPEPVVADVPAGPRRVLVMEVRHHTDEPWCPYPGDESIAAAVSQWTIRGQLGSRWLSLDPSTHGFIEKALAAIQDAASPSCRTLLVVDPRCLSEESSRAAVVGLLRNPCRAGLLIPADAADEQAKSILESYEPELKSANNEGQWVIRPCVGTMGDFYIGADSVANDLLARIVLTDQVRQVPPDNDGPSVRPRMTNRLEDQQAA
jgi:hypothetical protein